MRVSPVSDILWHFTGGPKWDAHRNCQEKQPKPDSEALKAFLGILGSKEVRIGGYHEVVQVVLPERTIANPRSKKGIKVKIPKRKYVVNTKPVCCLGDIPKVSMKFHSKRYGKFAIGFHRESAIRAGFHPAFYALNDREAIKSLWGAFSALENFSVEPVIEAAHTVGEAIDGLQSQTDEAFDSMDDGRQEANRPDVEVPDAAFIEEAAGEIEAEVVEILENLTGAMAYVKTVSNRELNSIYAEREWRSLSPFKFKSNDIAALVLPAGKDVGARDWFLKNGLPKLGLSKSLEILTWDEL